MSIPRCYGFKDGCIFVSKFQTTSLLDICNLVMQMDKTNVEPIAMYFTIEMLNILEKLHKSQIIHGDIKPDNFLIQREIGLNTDAPNAHSMFKDLSPTLEAIDFGISIDMSLFPKDQTFDHQFDKVNNRCPEMLQKKSWNYHVSIVYFNYFFLENQIRITNFISVTINYDLFFSFHTSSWTILEWQE